MFPSHCKEVSVKRVGFELTAQNIKQYLQGKRAYLRTRYYVFNNGPEWAVALIVRKPSNDVLQEISSVHVLSLPHETSFVEDPSLEVLSASAMGELRAAKGTKCVVVRGRAEHISFFIEEPPYELTVFDVVPPSPSKLEGLVRTALETSLQDRYVRVRVVTIDLNSLAAGIPSDKVMFPCRASGLERGEETLFLDETPQLSEERLKEVVLVGCSLSARIFKAVYGLEPRMTNMCPQDLLRQSGTKGPVLVKCCKVKEGYQVDGDVAIVPWGARATEVAEALMKVLR
jgi:hypothetical protein